MQRESISRQTFLKGIAAGAVVAASLGTLNYNEYSTADKLKKHDFVPGTYSSSAKGMESDVKVTITVDKKSITDVAVDVSGETAGIGAAIGEEVRAQILDAQNSMIDGVAGATVSSDAVREALDAAIAKAEAGEADPETEAVTETVEEAVEAATEGAVSEEAAAPAGASGYVPGTYSSSAKGMESDVKVDVTVDESSITDVAVDVSGETAGIGAEIADTVKEQILAAQSAQIDGVAGATVSSNAVKTALADALAQASAGGAEATEAVSEAVGEAAEEAASAGGVYVPGSYSASAAGMESDVKVDVTVDDSSITDVAVDVSGETAGIGAEIADTVKEQILAAQSAEIEGVAGATVSSNAVKTALADALAQASAGAGKAEAAQPVADGNYVPGSYTASAPGLQSDVTVYVTVNETDIVAAGVDASGETPEIGGAAGPELAKQILAAQSDQIDGVAGATITSDAAKTAVAAALAQAQAGSSASADGTAAAAAGDAAGAEAEAETETAAAEAQTEAVGAEAETEAAGTEVAAEANSGVGFIPGTYVGSAQGMASDVSVAITVDENKIIAAGVNASGETPEIGAAAAPELAKQILAAQTGKIDGVAGATITSDAVRAAAAYALGSAAIGDASFLEDVEAAEGSVEAQAEAAEAAEAETEAAEEPAAEAVPGQKGYTPGTYFGSAPGMESDVTVTLIVNETGIVSAGVNASGETPEIGAAAASELAKQILDAQGAEIDGVAGATVTSDAVRAATASALAQAAGGEGAAEGAEVGAEAADTETETAEAETEAAEAETEVAEEPAAEANSGVGFIPGTYVGSAQGMASDVSVAVIVDESKVIAAAVNASGETPEIGAAAAPELAKQLLAAQTGKIDGVAGATITSDAVRAAAAYALGSAAIGDASFLEDVEAAEGSAEAQAEAAEVETEAAEEPAAEAETEAAEEPAAEAETEAAEEPAAEANSGVGFIPGTYVGSAQGMASDVSVAVTVDESRIVAAAVNASGETPEIGAAAAPELAKQLLAAQTGKIDGVAGATITSDAVRAAAAYALGSAAIGDASFLEDVAAAEGSIEAQDEAAEAEAKADEIETEAAEIETESGLVLGIEDLTEAEAVPGEAAIVEETAEAEAAPVSGKGYTPGTYTASAQGMEGDVTVTITFDENRIVAVGINVSSETQGIGAAAGAELTKQILAAQGAGIDGVSGATITSQAAAAAAGDCIAQASN